MNFLLKIVEGPMKGAEIALVEGLRVRIGSGEDCDIVLNDSALPAEAFSLDVKSDSVSFIQGEEVKTLVQFEVFESGSSAFAIGPAEGAWQPLKRPAPEKDASAAKAHEPAPAAEADAAPDAGAEKDASASGDSEKPQESDSRKHHGCLAVVCLVVILLLAAFAVWYFWPRIVQVCPKAEETRVTCVDWVRGVCGSKAKHADSEVAIMVPSLADIARQYNLVLTNTPASRLSNTPTFQPVLRGNFVRRTERMAVRALALAADPTVKLELTDDESLATAAKELLFVVTEDAITATSATNGIVTIAGYAPSVASLERTIRALNADVPGLRNVLTAAVRIGGVPPPKRDAPKQVFADPTQPSGGSAGSATSGLAKSAPQIRSSAIAGILTTPYKTVVLANGMRVTEGGMIGGAVVERIEPDRLVLKSGGTTFEWKP